MASTSSTRRPTDMHGLTASQLSELQGAVQALDTYLLSCVDDLRSNRWVRPNTKQVADCLVRELVRNVAHRFQVEPITDTTTRHHRTELLTGRVRAIMRAFGKNPNYLSGTPNITWDDSFIPPNLYDDLETELASLDVKENQQVEKEEEEEDREKERVREKVEKQMSKEKAKATQNDKGKTKETAQDKDDTENLKRKWKTSESSLVFDITGDNEDSSTSADEAEPITKRVKHSKKSIDDDVGIIPVPHPCRRCDVLQIICKPNGWGAACSNCRKVRRTCSLSKALQNDKGKAKETAEDNEKPDDTEKPKTQRPNLKEMRTSIYALTKSILDERSSIEDEDVDQLDDVPAKPSSKNLKKVSITTTEVFIANDPKCGRCEESRRECVRKATQDSGRCTYCANLKKGCTLTGQSKIDFILNDPKCERCERSQRECVRKDTQDKGARCKHCVKDHQKCKYLPKGQSNISKPKPPPQASKPTIVEEGSSSSSSPRNFELEHLQQQLKVSQEDLRIAQQQLQLANSRIEAQRELYEAQLAGYRGQGKGRAKERG